MLLQLTDSPCMEKSSEHDRHHQCVPIKYKGKTRYQGSFCQDVKYSTAKMLVACGIAKYMLNFKFNPLAH